MFKKMMVLSALVLFVCSFSGNGFAGSGGTTISKKTRTQTQTRDPQNKNCDGPQTQTRNQTRVSY